MSTLPSATWRMLSNQLPTTELPKGLDAAWDSVRGVLRRSTRRTGHFMREADRVLELDKTYAAMTDPALRAAAAEMKIKFRTQRDTPEDLYHAVAIVREVASRIRSEKHYPVQVAGALALHAGCIVEMATGEGKTLTATIPATIAGWRGRGCHVITVNDYLAKRDALEMQKIYSFCGLTTDWVENDKKPPERRAAYYSDITYGTNKEICADFLRDRLALGQLKTLSTALLSKILYRAGTDRLVMRGLHYGIVDEADSVLIDEAVTPLIISGDAPNNEAVDAFEQAALVAAKLTVSHDFTVNPRYREVEITDDGADKLAEITEPLGGIWHGARRREELIMQALTAREFYLLGKQYVIQEGKVVIVDESTGRLMPDRTWREGLHQAIEAKERLKVNPPKDTFARVSFQRFFRTYKALSGMSGTCREATREMWQIYHLPVVVVPTNRKCIRREFTDKVFTTESSKYAHLLKEIQRIHATGQPILVGTRSVRSSERLSELLLAESLPHQVLNAVRHAEEAQIVAEAGKLGKITVATNMAGRGTDIKLGKGVKELGGLYVIAAERNESRRIDRQLFGRAARQGDPGMARAYTSLEDEILMRYTPRLSALLRRRYGKSIKEIGGTITRGIFDRAQRRGNRMALSQRRQVLRSDDWLDESLGFAGADQ